VFSILSSCESSCSTTIQRKRASAPSFQTIKPVLGVAMGRAGAVFGVKIS
jgi:hypothetical protein